MYRFIEKIANENGLSAEQADHACMAIIGQLLRKMPEMENIIDDVFDEEMPEIPRIEISRLINQLQYRGMEHLKKMIIPEQTYRFPLNNAQF